MHPTPPTRSSHAAAFDHERYRVAAEAAQLGFWDFDVRSNRITYGDHMLRLMGGTPGVAWCNATARATPCEQGM